MEPVINFKVTILEPLIGNILNPESGFAFCINERFYTYNEFGQTISKIRSVLKEKAKSESFIGLVANDDIETYASIFATWLEGKAYIPLHPKQPFDRSLRIIEQVGIKVIIDSSENSLYKNFEIVTPAELNDVEMMLEINQIHSDNDPAYILFTSGTTGDPKGVIIARKNLVSFTDAFLNSGIHVNSQDRCLQCFDLTFDVSVQSYLIPLLKGACVYTIPHDQVKYTFTLLLLDKHKITFGAMAPSMLKYLRPYFSELHFESMKYCILTAEASSIDLVYEWSKCIPNSEIYDFYGPTEATIYCTCHKLSLDGSDDSYNGLVSIGKPLNGITAIIINNKFELVTPGEKGELCVAGDQLTPGYWKNDQKNLDSFFEFEIEGNKKRFYHTGDLCYLNAEKDIMYCGRLDYQVKIQGYRIELGEIEHHARSYFNGKDAVAVSEENNAGNMEIALFFIGEESEKAGLKNYLVSKLPPYTIPAQFINIDEFPLNTSGKIDRNTLKLNIK